MNDRTGSETAAERHVVCEVVGVLDSAVHLNEAVEQLAFAGIDRAAISVLGKAGPRKAAGSIVAMSDDPSTPLTAFESFNSESQIQGMSIAIPMEIAGFGAAWAMAAAGSALLLAIGATVVSGGVGAGLGALLYHVVARRHEAAVRAQLARGGLILWVRVANKATEERVLSVLGRCGAESLHTHMINRPWGVENSPLHGVEPDPFLVHDPEAS
jgi:hypothetical protein